MSLFFYKITYNNTAPIVRHLIKQIVYPKKYRQEDREFASCLINNVIYVSQLQKHQYMFMTVKNGSELSVDIYVPKFWYNNYYQAQNYYLELHNSEQTQRVRSFYQPAKMARINDKYVLLSQYDEKNIIVNQNILDDIKSTIQTPPLLKNQTNLGFLFHGPPGTGKTTLVKYIQRLTGFDLKIMDAKQIYDKEKKEYVQYPDRTIILFDEIDKVSKEKQQQLIQTIDGFNQPHKSIFIFIGNDINKINSILLRPGRITKKYYIGELNQEAFNKFFVCNDIQPKPYRKCMLVDLLQEYYNSQIAEQDNNEISE